MTWSNSTAKSEKWFVVMRKRLRMSSEYSTWWHVTYRWTERLPTYLTDLTAGRHTFSPLQQIHFPKETVIMWGYIDRLMASLIHHIIKPTLQHVISSRCMNMGGPSQVPVCIKQVCEHYDEPRIAEVF